MPINRAPWNALIDDSGQNLDGSIWNKAAIKDVLLDPIDALAAAGAVFSPWTPTDSSSAGLVFTSASGLIAKISNLVAVVGTLTYPTTSDPSPTAIGGLPYPNRGPIGGFYQNYFHTIAFYFATNQLAFNIMDPTTGANKTNAQMSGALLTFTGIYFTG
jgi:hypothetical protein